MSEEIEIGRALERIDETLQRFEKRQINMDHMLFVLLQEIARRLLPTYPKPTGMQITVRS